MSDGFIRIWCGDRQRLGHLGDALDDFNFLGHVERTEELESLTCTVNGLFPPWRLTVGDRDDGFGDGRRLARTGHFNADIPIESLQLGENEIALIATMVDGSIEERVVCVVREEGGADWPTAIRWSEVDSPQAVGQCVDGEWIVGDDGLRTAHTGYDRVFLIGNRSWQDYEIAVPLTINRVDPETGPWSGGNGLGILWRFQGHVKGGHDDSRRVSRNGVTSPSVRLRGSAGWRDRYARR